jgi:nitrate reductase gamma subunit
MISTVVASDPSEETGKPMCLTDHIVFVTATRHSIDFRELPHAVKAHKTYLRRSMTSIRHGA